jgi:hypothetical protein
MTASWNTFDTDRLAGQSEGQAGVRHEVGRFWRVQPAADGHHAVPLSRPVFIDTLLCRFLRTSPPMSFTHRKGQIRTNRTRGCREIERLAFVQPWTPVPLTAAMVAHKPAFSATLLDDGNDRNAHSCRFR